MSSKFRTIDRDTPYLLPPSVQHWLPEDHLARFVVDIVDRLDLSAVERRYGGGGKDPYHPALLLSLLFYGYATGVFSSRKLERATYDSVAFRFIAGNTHPDHDTIASFRKRFLGELRELFVQILLIARETGVLKLGNVSLDGTKVRANASKHKALSWGYVKRLEQQLLAEVSVLLKQAAQADERGTLRGCGRDPAYRHGAGRPQHTAGAERGASPPPCPADADATTRMAHRLKTPEGRALYARRKSTVETVFGIIKEAMGFRRFHLRDLEAVRGEWTLICLAWNLKRMHALS